MKTLFRIFAAFALLSTSLLAQGASTHSPGASAVKVSLYVRGSADALKDLSYLQGGKALPLPVAPNRRGRAFAFTGGSPEFVVVRETRDATGKTLRQELGRATLPAGAKEVLLLGSTKGGALSLLPINLDHAGFPEGSFRVMNFSGLPMALRLGAASKQIAAGATVEMGPFAASDQGVECSFAAPLGQNREWRIFDTRGVVFQPRARYLLLAMAPVTAGGEPELVVIRDFVAKGTVK